MSLFLAGVANHLNALGRSPVFVAGSFRLNLVIFFKPREAFGAPVQADCGSPLHLFMQAPLLKSHRNPTGQSVSN